MLHIGDAGLIKVRTIVDSGFVELPQLQQNQQALVLSQLGGYKTK